MTVEAVVELLIVAAFLAWLWSMAGCAIPKQRIGHVSSLERAEIRQETQNAVAAVRADMQAELDLALEAQTQAGLLNVQDVDGGYFATIALTGVLLWYMRGRRVDCRKANSGRARVGSA